MKFKSDSGVGRSCGRGRGRWKSSVLVTRFMYHLSLAWASNLDKSTSELIPTESLSARVERYFSIFQRTRLSSFCSGGGAVRGFVS